MSSTIYIIFLMILSTGAEVANAQCQIPKDVIEQETRIFAQLDSHGISHPLRQDIVPKGTKINMICNASDIIRIVCRSSGIFNRTLPVLNCDTPIKSSVELVSDETCSFNTYRVGFRINDEFLELYRNCYDRTRVRAMNSKHQVFSYSIVTNRPEAAFTIDRIITSGQAMKFRTISIVKCFEKLLGKNQQYITTGGDYSIDRGHLTPSADFLIPSHMSATFKYINVIPQFSSINRNGNWRIIERWVASQAAEGPVTVQTGVLADVLELADAHGIMKKIYLGCENHTNPVPKWIYKIVTGSRRRYVFLIYNNIFDQTGPETVPCRTIRCPMRFTAIPTDGFTFCCNATSTYF